MTFDEWKAGRDWWKQNTPFAFKPTWDALVAAGHEPEKVARMMDDIGAAVSREFGGSW